MFLGILFNVIVFFSMWLAGFDFINLHRGFNCLMLFIVGIILFAFGLFLDSEL